MLISGVAPVVAPLIGGQILRLTDWRGVFVVLTVIGVLLTFVVWRIREDNDWIYRAQLITEAIVSRPEV